MRQLTTESELTMEPARRQPILVAALVCALALIGCQSFGPHTVATDRFDYSSAIADSWKQQTLLNIVKLRYLDLPVFVDVSSVVAGYSLQTGIGVAGTSRREMRSREIPSAGPGRPSTPTDRPSPTRR